MSVGHSSDHLIEIYRKDKRLGCGVRLTRNLALTAAHCLGEQALRNPTRRIRLRLADGTGAQLEGLHRRADLALIRLTSQNGQAELPRTLFDNAEDGEPWHATHQLNDPIKYLAGRVITASFDYYRTDTGMVVKALQLQSDSSVADAIEYFGSPIARVTQSETPVVLGLLVQPPNGHRHQADTLFAGSVSEALELFDISHVKVRFLPQDEEPSTDADAYVIEETSQTRGNQRNRDSVDRILDSHGLGSYVHLELTG